MSRFSIGNKTILEGVLVRTVFKLIIAGLLSLIVVSARADVILSLAAKYGANGYDAQGNYSSTSSSYSHKNTSSSTSSTVDNFEVKNRVQLVPGLMLQTVPEEAGGMSFGGGVYSDSTVNAFIGIRL